jgi:amino acid adenylation domain-containing protein
MMTRLLQEWLDLQAERRADATALVMLGQVLSYGELERRSNQLARLLKAAGCKRGDRVCFAIPKSFAAIVAILGILKAGCIHVPMDSSGPVRRAAKSLSISEPRYILGAGSVANFFDELFALENVPASTQVGWLDDPAPDGRSFSSAFSLSDLQSYSPEPLSYANDSADVAHILFTSGSTGEPKGVAITHSNVIAFVEWAVKYFGIDSSDRMSCHPPLYFDLSYFDIFSALSVGAQVHLVPPELSVLPNNLAEFIRSSKLTQWFSVPSVLSYMAKFDVVRWGDFPALKRLLWCGEVLPTPALIWWMKRLPQVTFTNLYGPTETTIASSYYTVSACPEDEKAPIPIGSACDGEEVLVLDDQLVRVPTGQIGNLHIRGVGLSPGYWRDPEATKATFLSHGPDNHDRIYRTGDLARIGEGGLVYFVGRADSQIKSRGYRIELGEIEAALHTLNDLEECAVVAIPNDGFETNLICCAYVLSNGYKTNNTQLRTKLSKLVPTYMLPARWMCLDQLPANGNGKVDRRKLREFFAIQETEIATPRAAVPTPVFSVECGKTRVSIKSQTERPSGC